MFQPTEIHARLDDPLDADGERLQRLHPAGFRGHGADPGGLSEPDGVEDACAAAGPLRRIPHVRLQRANRTAEGRIARRQAPVEPLYEDE